MSLLEDAKGACRVTTNDPSIVNEISDLIDAARSDLIRAGVSSDKVNAEENSLDPLIKRAIIVYCKANFGFDNPDAERLTKSYDMIRQELSNSYAYKAVSVDET